MKKSVQDQMLLRDGEGLLAMTFAAAPIAPDRSSCCEGQQEKDDRRHPEDRASALEVEFEPGDLEEHAGFPQAARRERARVEK
jgi:hypothetical protein